MDFFLFFFSEISCWGNKTPCNFQQWKVNQFFCLKKTPKPHFHISIFNFCTCMYISVIFQPHVAICLCSEGFFFFFFFLTVDYVKPDLHVKDPQGKKSSSPHWIKESWHATGLWEHPTLNTTLDGAWSRHGGSHTYGPISRGQCKVPQQINRHGQWETEKNYQPLSLPKISQFWPTKHCLALSW